MGEGSAPRAQGGFRKAALVVLGAVLLGVAVFALFNVDLLEGWGASLAARFKTGLPLPLTLIIVFFAGVLTSLTPCVYPVVPLAVTYLGARSASSRLRAFSLAAAYVVGMVACYTALGAAAGLTGTTFGAATQKWWIYAGVATIVLIFGLSMLGLFTITLPSSLQNLIGRSKGPGYKGAFLMGATSGLVTAPCTAPVLGTLIIPMISRQSVFLGSLLLADFGLGMGMLFLVVGTYSGVLSSLPKSGRWMNTVKVALGVAILLVSGYFFYQAWHLLPFRGGAREQGVSGQWGESGRSGQLGKSDASETRPADGVVQAGFGLTAARPAPAQTPAAADAPGAAPTPEAQGPPAPEFSIVDVGSVTQELSAYRGKTLHIVFFAAWCPPCVDQLKRVEGANARLRGRGYRVLVIGLKEREDADGLRAFADQRGLGFPVAYDATGAVAKAFGIETIPAHVIIGPDGHIVYRGRELPDGFERNGAGLLPH